MTQKLRSHDWFGRKDKDGIIYRSWMKNQGMPNDYFDGRPVIGICNTFSELTPCNAHFRDHAEMVKRGVLEVVVRNSSVSSELGFVKSKVLKVLARIAPEHGIKNIRVSVGTID